MAPLRCMEPLHANEALNGRLLAAAKRHARVPPGWYEHSIRDNLFQRYWHWRRFAAVSAVTERTGGRILDIGAADGMFTGILAEASGAQELIGIDVLRDFVEWANLRWAGGVMRFELGDAHALNFPDASFDAVFALEVLEHVENPSLVLAEVQRVLRPGGYAVFLVPTESLLFRTLWFFWTKSRGAVWAETHIQTFKRRWLVQLAAGAGFSVEVDRTVLSGMLHLLKVRT